MSIENGSGPDFLKQKYDLHNSPEVESAANRTEHRTGEALPQDTDSQIQNYLTRISEYFDRVKEMEGKESPEKQKRYADKFKNILHNKFVIKSEEIPEAYYENQQRLARELGHGDIEITDEMRKQNAEIIIADQESTLDHWVDYLSSEDATYPDWLKYFAIRSITQMGGFDKERHAFSKRSKGTTKPFPDLNREALAYVLDAMEKKYEGKDIDTLQGEEKDQFNKLLTSENFAKLYAWAIEKVTPASVEQISNTNGKWVKYNQNSNHMPLVKSLQGHGTGWCTAGESTAQTQLSGGDFYVYYSVDQQGSHTIPRAAIRMQGDQIGEVRGIAPEQNLDPYIADIVEKKLQEFPDGKAYEKKNDDMKYLTFIENKIKAGDELFKDDLIFLYEINFKIEGFGYQRDPRIAELRSQRDPKIDASIVMECTPQEIAWSQNEINESTKTYVGLLFPGIFTQLGHLEHLYTAFPEDEIRRGENETTGETGAQSKIELEDKGIHLDEDTEFMQQSPEFIFSPSGEKIPTVRLKVRDLFSDEKNHTYSQVIARANELGLDFLPHETASSLLLKEETQPKLGELFTIVTQPIAVRDGNPHLFDLGRVGGGLWLGSSWARPEDEWIPGHEFVFRLSQVSAES